MEQEQLIEELKAQGYYNIRVVPGRGLCGLMQFLFTIGLCEELTPIGYSGRYCYPKEKILESVIAIETWDGQSDPVGSWIKYKGSKGERHNDNFKE